MNHADQLAGSNQDSILFAMPRIIGTHLQLFKSFILKSGQAMLTAGYPEADVERALTPYIIAYLRALSAADRFGARVLQAAAQAKSAGKRVTFSPPPPGPGGQAPPPLVRYIRFGPGGGRSYLAADWARQMGTFAPIIQAGREIGRIMAVLIPAFARFAKAVGISAHGLDKHSVFDLYRWAGII